jgi:hypothetical membrane protein
MNFKISSKKAYLIEILGMIQYIILIVIGMFTYAGGTRDNPTIPGYSFWFNTFSDLGRLTAYNGKSNIISMVLFSIAYCLIAITMVPFYRVFPRLFNENSFEKKLTQIGAVLGIISSIFLIGIVLIPADISFSLHTIFAITAYVAIFFMVVVYTIALFFNKRFSKGYTYVFIIFSVVYFIFLMMALTALILDIRSLLTIGQKIGRISILICFPILTFGAWKLDEE